MSNYLQPLKNLAARSQQLFSPVRAQYTQHIVKNPYLEQTQQRWQQLTKRERYLVMGASALFLFVALYQFMWLPLTESITRYQQDVINDQETLAYMQMAAPRILAAKGQTTPTQQISADMLLPTIEKKLTDDGMMDVVSELSLKGDQVSLQFNEVEFDGLMQWLVQLRQQYGIEVSEFNAVASELPGFVNASMQIGN